jgi:phosphate transport system substrate-binding protein
MKPVQRIALLLVFGCMLAGCAQTSPDVIATLQPVEISTPTAKLEMVDISGIDAFDYPRVDGSTSAYPLQVMVACKILDVRCKWTEGDFFTDTRRIAPTNSLLATDEHEAILSLYHSGTHGAYLNLIEEAADLIIVAREPSDDELAAAEHEKINLDVRPVALDAFVFLVHQDNPVGSLTLQQIRDIYTGKITNWAEVGGLDAEIHTYQRNPNSGSQELMEKLVMRGETMLDSPDMILMSMMGPFSAIHDDPLGIGYSVFFYAENIYPDENVRMIAIDGTPPTSSSIADQVYPLVTEVYVVLRGDMFIVSNASTLRDWLLTAEGQSAVEASGYVGLPDPSD